MLCQSVSRLGAFAFTNEAAFFDKAAQQRTNATIAQGLFEGDGDVFVRDGFFAGKQFNEACLDVCSFCLNCLTQRHLPDLEALRFLQQLTVGTEVQTIDADVFPVIAAVLHLDVALHGNSESADSGQCDRITLLELMNHDTLYGVERSQQFALRQHSRQA